MNFNKLLTNFLNSKSSFSIIYSTSSFLTDLTKRVCVLDSSFNPPHLGHYTLAKEALNYHYKDDTATTPDSRTLLLLLSVKNADKENVPASFLDRIEMMSLMADYLNKNLNVNVSIGLTNHARFVDKSLSILDYIHLAHPNVDTNTLKLTFLVGFDTLIRIFDPKYYLPDKLSDSLNNFMRSTDLFCLTRNDENNTYLQQINFMHEIQHGKHEHIPHNWSHNIFMLEKTGDYDEKLDTIGAISSSNIRNNVKSSDWHQQVIPEVKQYITENDLYI